MLTRTAPALALALVAALAPDASAQPTNDPATPTPPAAAAPALPAPAPAADATATDAAPAPEPEADVEPAPEAAPAPAEVAVADADVADDAAVAAAPEAHWYDALMVNGFASVGFTLNTNRPADDANQLRVFDTEDNAFNVDVIELVVQKPAAEPGQAGFRIDLTAGSAIPAATASAGLFRDADGVAQDVDLQQAVVSYIGNVGGKGLRLDVGKFVTHMGYELIEGYDGYNDNYSRSILFGYAIPFTHTGVKLGYPLTDKISGMVMIANGWDNVKDNNSGKTLGLQLAGSFDAVAAYLNYVGGPEQDGDNGNLRHVVDLVATYAASDVLSFGLNGDYGYEANAAGMGDQAATWMGAALYAKWSASDAVSLALRGEVFDDADGVRTGAAQTVYEGTLSPSVKLGDNVVLRGDVRFDRSSVESFMTSDGTSKQQVTVALNAIGVM